MMPTKTSLLLLVLALSFSISKAQVPEGFGQLDGAPKSVPGGTDDEGRKYSYLGQLAKHQKIVLTASNGFFSKGVCVAKGESKLPKVGDDELIVPNFEHLDWKRAEGSLRWHILVAQAGEVQFQAHMDVANAGAGVEVSFAGQTQKVSTSKGSADRAQPWNLKFQVEEPGEYELSLRSTDASGGSVGQLHRVDAFGEAMEGAHLLRVRWRPAAAHGGYDTTKVNGAKLLVFTTRSMTNVSNYSPVTTPFGYYGTTFDANRRSGGGFNFSMWGKEDAAADLKKMPHLLAVGSPEGEFSGFGHEGSGVKPRGWEPMPDRPELVIQALRLVSEDEYDCYYGYYFDQPTQTWKLYGAGKKWHGGKPVEHLKLGSFCEVPGPPQVERTGDVYREVRRMGWAYDDGKWTPIEQYNPGGSGSKGDIPVNKSWYTTKDGEYAMGCGGIRLYTHDESLVKPGGGPQLPDFLSNPSIQTVFTLPVEYGEAQASEVASDKATIEFDIVQGGELTESAVFFGTSDSLTFAPRELHGTERNSDLSNAINDMAWKKMAKAASVQQGVNRVQLTELEPETTYYFRILSTNSVSRVWNHETLQFTTPNTGAAPIKPPALVAAKGSPSSRPATSPPAAAAKRIDGEPVRTWTYSLNGKTGSFEGRLTAVAGSKIQVERKSDGKKHALDLSMFSDDDKSYVDSKR